MPRIVFRAPFGYPPDTSKDDAVPMLQRVLHGGARSPVKFRSSQGGRPPRQATILTPETPVLRTSAEAPPQPLTSSSGVLNERGSMQMPLPAEPSLAQVKAILPQLRQWLTNADSALALNQTYDGRATDAMAMPFILAALNHAQPDLKAHELDWAGVRQVLSTLGDDVVRGIVNQDGHYTALLIKKQKGKQAAVLNVDDLRAVADPFGGRETFRSKGQMSKLARAFPEAQFTWASTQGLSGHDCAICAVHQCETTLSQFNAFDQMLQGRPGNPLPKTANLRSLPEGQHHLPVECFMHTQGKSHIEDIERFAGVVSHWKASKVKRDVQTETLQGTQIRRLTFSGSIERQRIQYYKKAIGYCESRMARG